MNESKTEDVVVLLTGKGNLCCLAFGQTSQMKVFIPLHVKSTSNTVLILLHDICPSLWCQTWNWFWL